ncbi:hypothetical protein [Inconstantimicrobium porci]|nr:hypothetical protein [Inconstantimicrobium porci]
MNFFIVISIIMTAITLISILIEPRRFRNGVLRCYDSSFIFYDNL